MRLCIDASNIRGGGGVTHLVELLREAKPFEHGFSKIIVWSGHSTLDRIENKSWLKKEHQQLLDKGFLCRMFGSDSSFQNWLGLMVVMYYLCQEELM